MKEKNITEQIRDLQSDLFVINTNRDMKLKQLQNLYVQKDLDKINEQKAELEKSKKK